MVDEPIILPVLGSVTQLSVHSGTQTPKFDARNLRSRMFESHYVVALRGYLTQGQNSNHTRFHLTRWHCLGPAWPSNEAMCLEFPRAKILGQRLNSAGAICRGR